jgi:hypothetical protein
MRALALTRPLTLPLALMALSGCGGEKAPETKGSSFGEVLPGSASDAMLPYDTATSSPPLAPNQGSAPGKASDPGTPSRADSPASDDAPEPEPEAS